MPAKTLIIQILNIIFAFIQNIFLLIIINLSIRQKKARINA